MNEFNVDLHIHSLHSIGVSRSMTVPQIAAGAKQKGLHIIGTGDATQPDWLDHLKTNLHESDGVLTHESIAFIPTVEIEDNESIHHLVLLPSFESVKALRKTIKKSSPNLDSEWGGRPRVNMKGEGLATAVREAGGMIGPAHAFTPFKSVFREGKYESLSGCYGKETGMIHFLELGLSADTDIADCIPELERLTFITSSDAHSPSPDKLGREFVRFRMEAPTYDELRAAILRKEGRRSVLNIGLDPRLGKYYLSFCSSCRRTLVVVRGSNPPSHDDLNIYMSCDSQAEQISLLREIRKRRVKCPVDGKNLRLGVRDRASMIGGSLSRSPSHRPPYLHIPPLLDIISTALMSKSKSTRTARLIYDRMLSQLGQETAILTDVPVETVSEIDQRVGQMVDACRQGRALIVAGGGGRYGRLIAPWEEEGPENR